MKTPLAIRVIVLFSLLALLPAALADSVEVSAYWSEEWSGDAGGSDEAITVEAGEFPELVVFVTSDDDFRLWIEILQMGNPAFSYSVVSNLREEAGVGRPYLRIFPIPTAELEPGNYRVRVSVQNGAALDNAFVELTITEPEKGGAENRVPSISAISDVTLREGETRTVTAGISDPEGNEVTVQVFRENCSSGICFLNPLPRGVSYQRLSESSLQITLAPDFDFVQHPERQRSERLVVRAYDENLPVNFVYESFTVTVNDVNLAPEVSEPSSDLQLTLREGETETITVSAADADGDELGVTARQCWFEGCPFGFFGIFTRELPEEATFINNGDGTWSLQFSPGFDYVRHPDISATLSVRVRADDGRMVAGRTILFAVNDVNQVPAIEPLPEQVVRERENLAFTVVATDGDAEDAIRISIEDLPRDAEFVDHEDGTASVSWTPQVGDAGFDSWTIIAADQLGAEDAFTVEIRVLEELNARPVLEPLPHQSVNEGEELSFAVRASDADGDRLGMWSGTLPEGADYRDRSSAEPAGMGRGVFTWTPSFEQAGEYEIEFFVQDVGHRYEPVSMLLGITVVDVPLPEVIEGCTSVDATNHDQAATVDDGSCNFAPIIEEFTIPDALLVGEEGLFLVMAADPDGDELTITWEFGDAENAIGEVVAHAYPAAGAYTATVTVDDGRGGVVSQSGVVTVSEEEIPCPDENNNGICDEEETPACPDENNNGICDEEETPACPDENNNGICDDEETPACPDENNNGICDDEETPACPDENNNGICDDEETPACPDENNNGICDEEEVPSVIIRGCTDTSARNFHPFATEDDSSCLLAQPRGEVVITSARASQEVAVAGEYVQFTVVVDNRGRREAEELRVRAFVYDLWATGSSSEFELDDGESKTLTLVLPIPEQAQPGEYLVQLRVLGAEDTAYRMLWVQGRR